MKQYICTDCNLYENCKTNKIIGMGDPILSKLMIVFDYPDKDDDYRGKLLSGDVANKIDYILSKVGLKRKDVYFTTAIRCKPKDDGNIKKKQITACRKYLAAEIMQVRPKMIIAAGKFAHWALTDIDGLSEFRGHFTKFSMEVPTPSGPTVLNVPVMPTFSFGKSMFKWEYHDYIIHDIAKAVQFLKNKGHKLTPVPPFKSVRSLPLLKEFYETMMDPSIQYATTDLETTGFKFYKDKIINAGYCTNKDQIFVVPLLEYGDRALVKKWTKEEIEHAKQINSFLKQYKKKTFEVVKKVNQSKHIKFIAHNGKFDLNFARFHGLAYHDIYFDTLLADSVVDENKMHSLNIAAEYRGHDFGAYDTKLWPYTNKDEKKKKSYQHVPVPLLEYYLSVDLYADKCIYLDQVKELERDGQTHYFMNQKMEALRLVIETEYIGTRFNKQAILDTHKILTEKINDLVERGRRITGIPDLNLGSDMQLLKYFYEKKYPFKKLGIRETKRGHSIDSDTLKKFAKIEAIAEMPKVILTYKALSKLSGTYVAGKIGKVEEGEVGGFLQHLDQNDRVHTSFNLWTPRTGRYSSNRPSLQVFPRPLKGLPNIRNFIIPSVDPKTGENWVLFEADYSALEMNVVAADSKDIVLIQELQNDVDIHSQNVVDLGRTLKTIPDEILYEHVLVANGKGDGILDPDRIATIQEFLKKYEHINFKEKRNGAKNVGFGLNYGKEAYTFAIDFNISEDEAQEMVDAYFKKYKGLKSWRDRFVREAMAKGYAELSSGRRRRINQALDWVNSHYAEGLFNANKLKSDIARQLMNYPVQGGAHDVFEPAIIRLNKAFREENLQARLLLLIHDGIVGECPPHEKYRVVELMKREMPVTFHAGTKFEVKLKIDTDLYKYEWYGEKIH